MMGRRERGVVGRTASDKAKVDRAATPEGRGKEMRRHQRKDDDNNKRKIHHTQRLTTTRTKCTRPKGMRRAAEDAEAAARRKSRLSLAVVWRLAVWRLVVVVVAGAWRRLLLLPRSGSQPLARSASRLGETRAGKDEEGQKG